MNEKQTNLNNAELHASYRVNNSSKFQLFFIPKGMKMSINKPYNKGKWDKEKRKTTGSSQLDMEQPHLKMQIIQ